MEKKIMIDDIELNYKVVGTGNPVIAIHGYYADHRLMEGCLEPIFTNVEKYQRIYIDLPGMGKSAISDNISSSDEILDIVIKFINIIIPNQSFILIGESYGGYIARGIVKKISYLIEGVMLICPLIIPEYVKRSRGKYKVLFKDSEFLESVKDEENKVFSRTSVIQTKYTYDRINKEINAGIKLANLSFLKKIKNTDYKFNFDVDKLENNFEKPCLFLFGRQDSVVGYKDAWKIIENYPRSSYIILDKAGHNLQIEQVNF